MKRISVFSIVALILCGLFATQAMADSFTVSAETGTRVIKSDCEKIGAISIVEEGDPGVNQFKAGTEIKVELLANTTICRSINADYLYEKDSDGNNIYIDTVGDYTVRGTQGDDYYLITIHTDGADENATENVQVKIGHEEHSPLCVNIKDSYYDPITNQKVEVTIKDDKNNTYSSDLVVAILKDRSPHDIYVCSKSGEHAGANGWPESVNKKTGLPEIPLCDPAAATPQPQDQDTPANCGCVSPASSDICIWIDDPDKEFEVNAQYNFTITNTKPGIGIVGVKAYHYNNMAMPLNVTSVTGDGCESTTVTFTVTMGGAGKHYIVITPAYNSCKATPGDWVIDITGSKVPCGDSFSKEDITVATFVDCGEAVSFKERVFPYFPNFDAEWWSGLALTNPNGEAITVTLNIYEADGDKYTATVAVPANGINAGLMGDAAFFITAPAKAAGVTDAEFGDERFWILGTCPSPFYGFAMIGDGTQAQGYLALPH